VQVQSDGSFDISRVSPGSHVLSAAAGNVSGRIAVDVFDRDVNAISLALAPGLTVSGRVLIDGPSARTVDPRFTELRISLLDELIPAGFRQNNRSAALPLVTPRADGSFTIPASSGGAVPAGRYRVLVGPILTAAAGWASPPAALPASVMPTAVIPSALEGAYVKSVRMGDINVLDDGLRLNTQPSDLLLIVLGTNPGSLEGRVRNQQQRAVAGATVVLIPESGLQFKVNHKFTSTDVSGGFRITAIPPGNYSLYAWENVEAGAWQDPDFVGSHRGRGTPIQVREGQKLSLTDIVSIPARP
jgi:hypothetical protein